MVKNLAYDIETYRKSIEDIPESGEKLTESREKKVKSREKGGHRQVIDQLGEQKNT